MYDTSAQVCMCYVCYVHTTEVYMCYIHTHTCSTHTRLQHTHTLSLSLSLSLTHTHTHILQSASYRAFARSHTQNTQDTQTSTYTQTTQHTQTSTQARQFYEKNRLTRDRTPIVKCVCVCEREREREREFVLSPNAR